MTELSRLPTGWTRVPLAEIAEVVMGQSPSGSTYNDAGEGLPFFQGKADFGSIFPTTRGWCSAPAKVADAGDVLLSVRAPVGPTNLCAETSAIGRGLAALRPRTGISGRYLLYALRASEADLKDRATGSTFEAISGKVVREHLVTLAPRHLRDPLVAGIELQLSRIEEASSVSLQARAHIETYRRSLLQAATTGRLTTRSAPSVRADQEVEIITGTHPLEASLPPGWKWERWRELGDSQNGRAFPSKEYSQAGIKLLRPGNLGASGRITWTHKNTRYLPDHWADEASTFVIGPDELIMNLTAQSLKDDFLGRVCLTGPDDHALLNQRLARLSPHGLNKRYLLWVLKSPLFRRFVKSLNTGSLIQHMFTSQLAEFEIPVPPPYEQELIAAEVERRMSLVEAVDASLSQNRQRGEALRRAILRAAFAGLSFGVTPVQTA